MSQAIGGILREQLTDFCEVYVATYARSYFVYDPQYPGYGQSLVAYCKIIRDNADAIYRAATAGVSRYIYDYSIHVDPTVDEFKCVYFLGLAIHTKLLANGQPHAANVHLFTMIGLLDARLRTMGFGKKQLLKAMMMVVRDGQFERDLGTNGCYLIYKCVSTSDNHKIDPVPMD